LASLRRGFCFGVNKTGQTGQTGHAIRQLGRRLESCGDSSACSCCARPRCCRPRPPSRSPPTSRTSATARPASSPASSCSSRSVPTDSRRTPRRTTPAASRSSSPANDAGDVVIALDGNDEITCEALGNSRWNVYFVFDGGTQFYGQYNIKLSDGATQNLKNLTPITPPPANLTLDYALRNADNTFAAARSKTSPAPGRRCR
jgi:hypothetical protein